MFSIIATHNKTSVGINTYLVDTFAELAQLKSRPGSKAYVIETGYTYILKNSGEWVEYYSSIKKYIDEKLEMVDPAIVEELKELLEQIESGSIDEKIAEQVETQLATKETQEVLVTMIKEDPEVITVEKLETYNYIREEDLNTVIFNGGSAEI